MIFTLEKRHEVGHGKMITHWEVRIYTNKSHIGAFMNGKTKKKENEEKMPKILRKEKYINIGGITMRKSTVYICEGCGVDYATAEEAEECEKSHVKPVKIVKAEYGYSTERNIFRHIPIAVRIEMENGMEVTYYRKEER